MLGDFAMIANFRYHSEFSLSYRKVLRIEKISIFAMPVFFAMIAKIIVHSEIFASYFCVQTTPFWFFSFLPL